MVHPIFSVLVSKPELVVDHVAGYAALLREEASSAGTELASRAMAWGVVLMTFMVFLVLAGVAMMLGAVRGEFHWALIAVPALPLAVSMVALNAARKRLTVQAFNELKAQLDADARALRAVGARP